MIRFRFLYIIFKREQNQPIGQQAKQQQQQQQANKI